jgi:hypothetical protein
MLTAVNDDSVNDRFLRIWLGDPALLRSEFDEIVGN